MYIIKKLIINILLYLLLIQVSFGKSNLPQLFLFLGGNEAKLYKNNFNNACVNGAPQVPVIAANHPAQVIIGRAITNLDNDIRSFTFESQIRKQMMSETLSQILNYSSQQQKNAMQVVPQTSSPILIENGAVTKSGDKNK